jgi:ammonia channel protein AmtB
MGDVVEANLYRVHFSDKPNLYPLLLETALIGLSGLVAINVLMLWIAGWVWARNVNSIVKPFRELLDKVEVLDFSEDTAVHVPHKVVDLALAWRHTKRQRMLKLRTEIAKLNELGELSDAGARHHARASLEAIRELLPN